MSFPKDSQPIVLGVTQVPVVWYLTSRANACPLSLVGSCWPISKLRPLMSHVTYVVFSFPLITAMSAHPIAQKLIVAIWQHKTAAANQEASHTIRSYEKIRLDSKWYLQLFLSLQNRIIKDTSKLQQNRRFIRLVVILENIGSLGTLKDHERYRLYVLQTMQLAAQICRGKKEPLVILIYIEGGYVQLPRIPVLQIRQQQTSQ